MAHAEPHGRGVIGRIARSQGLVLPWCVALVLALAVSFFAPISGRWEWYAAAAGVSLIVTFIVQIIIGRADGFLLRTSTAAVGGVLIVGIVSLIVALFTAVTAGISLFPAEFASP